MTIDERKYERITSSVPYAMDQWAMFVADGPRKPALSDSEGTSLSRAELDRRVNCVNGFLREKGIGREDVVVIALSRGVNPVIAAYGVWKAGAAFCLVESDYARERIAYIVADCGAKLVVSDENWDEIVAAEPCAAYARPDDHDAFACVYTSGTTGHPKGVMHEFGQVKMEMVSERLPDGTYLQDEKTRWALNAPLNFVASLKILVHLLYCGGHLHVLGYDVVKDPARLSLYFAKHRINETFLSPMHLRTKKGDLGPFVKCVYVGAAPANNVSLRHGILNNCFTMSESLFTVCRFEIDRPYETCPVGTPLFDLDLFLLDEEGNEVSAGETGEMCFANPYCRGYLNNPDENAERFADGLFHSKDMASFENGVYVMRGRSDDMVKINGNRVEPLEIEACFTRIAGIDCVCKCFDEGAGSGFAVLYYLGNKGDREDIKKVRAEMAQELPPYMVPTFFEAIDAIPMTPLGKVDRKGLKKPCVDLAEYVEPTTELERRICVETARVLDLERVGLADDVFKLGCSSLDIIEILSELDVPGLTVDLFYRGKTIGGIVGVFMEECAGIDGSLTDEEMEMEGRKHRYRLQDTAYTLHYLSKMCPDQTDLVNLPVAYKLSHAVNLKRLRDAINAYTAASSTFKTKIIEDEEGNAFYAYAPELYRHVEIERMSEEGVRKLRETFVQPFAFGDELPWRIRLIKTTFHQYLFFDCHHVLSDGEGLSLIGEGIFALYQGKPAVPNNFFAWLYKENLLYNSSYWKECKDRLHGRFDDVDWVPQPSDPTDGIGLRSVDYDTGIRLEEFNSYLKRSKRARGDMFAGALMLAIKAYADGPLVAICSTYANRNGVNNVAGVRARILTMGFDLREMPDTVDDYLDWVNTEIREGIAASPYAYCLRKPGFNGMTITIDDLQDLEEPHPLLSTFATALELGGGKESSTDKNTEPSALSLAVFYLNRGGKLYLRLKRDVHWLSDASRDKFARDNIDALQRLMTGDHSVLE